MSDDSENKPKEKVGYGKPPRSGRFTKGKSGNPRGRPHKKKAGKHEWVEARFPTSEALRAEAARLIAITDASGRHEITTREAVIHALAMTAARGGVLAQRTLIVFLMAEDEKIHREKRERYEFWDAYQERERNLAAAARKAGRPEPDPRPHPEDIVLDAFRLEVRFLGAVDEKGREAEKQALAFQRLGFEMSVYLGEDNRLPCPECPEGRIGPYMAIYLSGWYHLPPRLRLKGEALEAAVQVKARTGRRAWGDDLERRCEEGDVPFTRWHKHLLLRTGTFATAGVQWPSGALPYAIPKARR